MQNKSLELRTFSCIRINLKFLKTANSPFSININAVFCPDSFFFWGNKGSIFSDLSLGYPLPGMSTTATSNLRPIQKHFSELGIQSTTFSNNVLITAGKIKWVKTTKAQNNSIKGLLIFADEEWTSASRTSPRRTWFLNTVRFFPSKSSFSSHFFFPVEYQQHSHFLSLLTDRNREHSLNTCWTNRKTRSVCWQ